MLEQLQAERKRSREDRRYQKKEKTKIWSGRNEQYDNQQDRLGRGANVQGATTVCAECREAHGPRSCNVEQSGRTREDPDLARMLEREEPASKRSGN